MYLAQAVCPANICLMFNLLILLIVTLSPWHLAMYTTITVDLGAARFPYFAQGRTIVVRQATLLGSSKSGGIYWNGTNWIALAGNNAGTQFLSEKQQTNGLELWS